MSSDVLQRMREDFRVFLTYVWRQLGLPDPTPVQLEIAHFLQHGPNRRMVKAFRGVGKSWITAAYSMWCLWVDGEERVMNVSASKDAADATAVFCRRLIEDIPLLRTLRPRPGQRDSVVLFDVGPASPHRQPSMKALGINGQLPNNRSTKLIADDIEVPSNSLTTLMRDRLAEQVKEFDSISIAGTDIIYLGTDQTEDTLYKKLPGRGYAVRIWPARIPSAKKALDYGDMLAPSILERALKGNEEGAPVDPARFSNDDLLKREAAVGRSTFAMQYMMDPNLSDMDRYPLKCRDLIVCPLEPGLVPVGPVWASDKHHTIEDLACVGLSGDRFCRPMAFRTEAGQIQMDTPASIIMQVDPSGQGADETAYAVLGLMHGKMYLLDVGGLAQGYAQGTLEHIARTAKRWGVNLIRVEPNFGGGMFRELLQPVVNRVHPDCGLEDSEWAKGQKEARIIDTLEPVMNQHRLVVNQSVVSEDALVPKKKQKEGCEKDLSYTYQLFHQLTRLTRTRGSLRHDDRVDAVAAACAYFLDSMGQDEEDAYKSYQETVKQAHLDDWLQRAGKALGKDFLGDTSDLWVNPR